MTQIMKVMKFDRKAQPSIIIYKAVVLLLVVDTVHKIVDSADYLWIIPTCVLGIYSANLIILFLHLLLKTYFYQYLFLESHLKLMYFVHSLPVLICKE